MIQKRGNQGEKQEHKHEVSVGVWQGSTLSTAAFCVTFGSSMADLMSEIKEWDHETLLHKKNRVVFGIQATERNSMMVDDSDTSMAKEG